jgi:hypothetical protein
VKPFEVISSFSSGSGSHLGSAGEHRFFILFCSQSGESLVFQGLNHLDIFLALLDGEHLEFVYVDVVGALRHATLPTLVEAFELLDGLQLADEIAPRRRTPQNILVNHKRRLSHTGFVEGGLGKGRLMNRRVVLHRAAGLGRDSSFPLLLLPHVLLRYFLYLLFLLLAAMIKKGAFLLALHLYCLVEVLVFFVTHFLF